MKKQKISHWLVIKGEPAVTTRTRFMARRYFKAYNHRHVMPYYYVGKVISDLKRPGHGKIIIDY